MKDKWKKFLTNPWTVAIGSGLVLSGISVIIDLTNKKQVFSTISAMFIKICEIFISILNYRIKIWWLLVGLIILILSFMVIVKCWERTTAKNDKPDFYEYAQDEILGYKWKWTWGQNIYGEYCVEKLCPVCSQCDTPLVEIYQGYGRKYKCLRCETEYFKPMPDFEHIKMLISDNVRRKYFPHE